MKKLGNLFMMIFALGAMNGLQAQIDKLGISGTVFYQGLQWKPVQSAVIETRPGVAVGLHAESYLGARWSVRGSAGLQHQSFYRNLQDVPADEYSPAEQLRVNQLTANLSFKRAFPGCMMQPYFVFGGQAGKVFQSNFSTDQTTLSENGSSIQDNNFNKVQLGVYAGLGIEFYNGLYLESNLQKNLNTFFEFEGNTVSGYQLGLTVGYYFKQASICRKKRAGVISMF